MKKILLIEDNKDIRENTAEILTLANYSVLTAENGKIGVELALKEKPDLIICDIMMPVLDGYGVLHLLSKNDNTANIPFVFLTAKAERSDFRKGMEMGADDYLTKPFDDMELLNIVDVRLRKSESLKKEFSKNVSGIDDFIQSAKGFESLKELSEKNEVRSYKKKSEIFREGAYPKGIYFKSTGKVKIFKSNDNGKELITSFYKEGEFFGFLDLLKDEQYSSSASALEDSEIYVIPKEDFFSLLYNNSQVARKFIEMLSDNLQETEQQLIKIAYDSVRKRVAEALVKLSDKYKNDSESQFSMYVSREDLANVVGTATETVIRTLSDFKESRYIDIAGGTITILDYDKLVRMKN